MKCKKCDYESDEIIKFCPVCGEEVKEIYKCNNCQYEGTEEFLYCPQCGKSSKDNNCNNCGTPIKDGDNFCQVCGTARNVTNQITNYPEAKSTPVTYQEIVGEKKKNYWKDPVVWIISISLLIICIIIGIYVRNSYLDNNVDPYIENDLPEDRDTNEYVPANDFDQYDSSLKIEGANNLYTNQANANNGGETYLYDGKLYLTTEEGIIQCDLDFSNQEIVSYETDVNYLSVDAEHYYYCNTDYEYIQEYKPTGYQKTLISGAYEIQRTDTKIYYTDSEYYYLYAYDINTNQATKIIELYLYNFTIDETNNVVFYLDMAGKLCQSQLDGNNKKVIVDASVSDYIYMDGSLYYAVEDGVYRYNMTDGTSIKLCDVYFNDINILGDKIIGAADNSLYAFNLDGSDLKVIFEENIYSVYIQGDKIITYGYDGNDNSYYLAVDVNGDAKMIAEKYVYDSYDYEEEPTEDIQEF